MVCAVPPQLGVVLMLSPAVQLISLNAAQDCVLTRQPQIVPLFLFQLETGVRKVT